MRANKLVFVYWNVTRKCWSIRSMSFPDKGIVIGYARNLRLKNCTFKVSEAGRQRVLKTGRKGLHAGIIGEVIYCDPGDGSPAIVEREVFRFMDDLKEDARAARYNPKELTYFVDTQTGVSLDTANHVWLGLNRSVHYGSTQ